MTACMVMFYTRSLWEDFLDDHLQAIPIGA